MKPTSNVVKERECISQKVDEDYIILNKKTFEYLSLINGNM